MNENKHPKVSVIMGAYNCADTVGDAIKSILEQDYRDFEFVICDDGSTDDTWKILKEWEKKAPEIIVLIRNEQNMKLNYTLNHCLKLAKGKYIARMDADDKSLPRRLSVEVDFMDHHPEYAILGAALDTFDEKGIWGKRAFVEKPTKFNVLKGSVFSHSVCMVRREAYETVKGYTVDDRLLLCEDYHLWAKMYGNGYKGYNLSDVLYEYYELRDKKRKFNYRATMNQVYACNQAVKLLHLPKYYHVVSLRPILVNLLPNQVYRFLHNRKLQK